MEGSPSKTNPEETLAPDLAHRNGAMWLAGEKSGDALAALVLPAVKERMGGALQYGIGGEAMVRAGLSAWKGIEALSVRGYVEVLRKLPSLLKLRSEVIERARAASPRVFVGVDAPDFNLGVEAELRRSGIPTVHFVSPSIWAWRPERIEKVRAAADLVLLVFPFEQAIYDRAGIPAVYVGHPMASQIPEKPDSWAARKRLAIDPQGPVFALLPGSRYDEIRWNGPCFLETARRVLRSEPESLFLVPAADEPRRLQIVNQLSGFPDVAARVRIFLGRSHDVLEACDAALIASGTATLEAALYKKPMVVSYRMPALSSIIMQSKGTTSCVSLPNILAGRNVVPEFLQYYAQPQFMAVSLLEQLRPERREALRPVFERMHESLRRDTAALASEAVAGAARRAP
ncbi:lipid-A-disaccharide synthase [Mesosutterella sp. AGMB02718]|uniref:Lipid-A-disaccharide synthase n=1 Tax=Mesosutterella faecium TaxID=2925194 RepID=A0ABT7IMN6_9BURK|nr:lipid-A-disaccharide synthase [Mesosutterella sp. AGMB02718]MDL2059634.1 lipid-A-disaccharide synthase [Mesosutterella sp. AGMB02718]